MTDREIAGIVHPDLHTLIQTLPPIVRVTRTSPLQSPTWARATFRLDLEGGGSIKGHQFEDAGAAEWVVALRQRLPRGPFPRITAHHGQALLSEWIDGVPLSSRAISREHLQRAGAIQRSIHEVNLSDLGPESPGSYPGTTSQQDLSEKARSLHRFGYLSEAACARAIEVMEAHAPLPRPVTLVHGDICPENLVIDNLGELHVVDNDGIDLHAPEFDLARTWYRWPMTDDEREVFEEGYGDLAVLSSFRQHFDHWAAVVLVGAAEFRCRWQLPGAEEPVGRLRDLLERFTP